MGRGKQLCVCVCLRNEIVKSRMRTKLNQRRRESLGGGGDGRLTADSKQVSVIDAISSHDRLLEGGSDH